eukprot:Tbor_TRINITY_DN5194_c1_g11::TRINITY_DN5194_c1_g11_i1::g.26193::m.26193
MGGKPSKAPGPKSFYLVFGGPPITFRRGPNRGPLIFHVDPIERSVDSIEAAETRQSPISCQAKQPYRLTRVSPFNVNAGFRLSFTISSLALPATLRIFAGVALTYSEEDGITLKPKDENQKQFLVHESSLAAGNNVKFKKDHSPILLHLLKKSPEEVTSEIFQSRVTESQIVVEISCPAEREEGNTPGATLYIFLAFNESDLDLSLDHDDTEEEEMDEILTSIGASCKKQYIRFGINEIFELDDIFGMCAKDVTYHRDQYGAKGATEDKRLSINIDDDDQSCVVCLSNMRDTTILPCRHLCMCSTCAATLKQEDQTCPMCRRPIEKLLMMNVN